MNQCHTCTENPAFPGKVQLTEQRHIVIESEWGRWRRKMLLLLLLVATVPNVATLDTNANRLDWRFLSCDYIPSLWWHTLFLFPSRSTHKSMCANWQLITLSHLPSGAVKLVSSLPFQACIKIADLTWTSSEHYSQSFHASESLSGLPINAAVEVYVPSDSKITPGRFLCIFSYTWTEGETKARLKDTAWVLCLLFALFFLPRICT